MHVSRIRRFAVALLVVFVASTLPAQQDSDAFAPTYTLGDQSLAINLGLFVPMFFAGPVSLFEPANLSLGGAGSLLWSTYLTNEISVGVELGGSFALTPNGRALFLVPIAARGSYSFRAYPFEFPVSLGAGLSIARLEDAVKVDPFIKPGGSFYWYYSTQWAFGANLFYWIIPQIYTNLTYQGVTETRVGNFLEFTLSARYHF